MDEIEAYKEECERANRIIVAIDIEGYVTYVNSEGSKALGYPEEEIVGKSWFNDFVPERDRKKIIAVFKKLMRNDLELDEFYENSIITNSGEERLIAWHNRFLKDDDGNNIGTISSGEMI